ncbi:Lipoprotein-anchoring transpeptidase ErfK/SrfK [Rubritalea squalenifaciens DSM 18772]|uniref:Lipoprotein-anchoring transpeptidase ErfK/SrfK n=2 Tax=Rubritalea TaxID=361050 RepID=A0A1M6HTX6_9BACT|nr:L,D-transpeptidase family protein [Rubritalea squalenifaciens]SHJ25558.1 Lipoprotein-anchoring transpeptidase ErfK/SrfK [Rubritalea squalenifaciens DSM 18772]
MFTLKSPLKLRAACLAAASCFMPMGAAAEDKQYDPSTFTWKPELSPKGPVVVAVCLQEQSAAVYRNGIEIGRCEVSTGKKGHETPTGVFHILNKDKDHHSKTYNNASMPFSERLTWDGVALHAGALPGYPSSHGCIHLPYEFSKKLFGITHKGTTVVITNSKPGIHHSSGHKVLVRSSNKKTNIPFVWEPEKAKEGPVSLIFSEKDKMLFVLRNGKVIGESGVATNFFKDHERGTIAFVCSGWSKESKESPPISTWSAISSSKSHHSKPLTAWFDLNPAFQQKLSTVITTGTNLVITDESVTKQTRSNSGFRVLISTKLEKAQ